MPVDTTHPKYDEFLPRWVRLRTLIAGEDALKESAEEYVPRLDSQSEEEYRKYVARAAFFNATGRTADGFSGMVFRRDPVVKLPDGENYGRFRGDVDLLGMPLYNYAKHVAGEILAVGRNGTLVEWHDVEQRPVLVNYAAESIINWRMERVAGRLMLSLVVLMETRETFEDGDEFDLKVVERIRVLRLLEDKGVRRLVVTVSEKEQKKVRGKAVWKQVEEKVPLRRGKPLGFIPFVFHGPLDDHPTPEKPPLEDIAFINLDHFRLDADFKHGLHFTALPTAWVAGFDKDATLKIGSTVAWVSDQPNASAGFLEFKGQGLQTHEREKDRCEKMMAILGSRMLEVQKRVSESAEALSLRQAGESSIVGNISTSISKSLTRVLRWVHWWLSAEEYPDSIPVETVSIELNKDFETSTMNPQELVAVVQAWQAGLLSRESAHDLMRQGEILPPSRTNEEEAALIESQPPPLMVGVKPKRDPMKDVNGATAGAGGGSVANA